MRACQRASAALFAVVMAPVAAHLKASASAFASGASFTVTFSPGLTEG